MSKNLVISTAILAATIATAACEKIPSGETNQSGSVRTEAGEQAKSLQTEPQERSDQTPNQATPAEIRQASKSAQGAPRETEQANKSTQPSPAQTQQANKFTQGALGENEQENKSPQAVPAGNEQENKSAQTEQASKSTQPAPAQTQQANNSTNAVPGGTEQQSEPGRQQAAEAGEDRNAESNTGGQPSQQDRTTVQSDGGTPAQSTAQPNQQDHAQLNAQKNRSGPNERAGGTVNLSPERGSAASGPINLSSDEIRRLQMVLNQKGFSVGKPDGVLGPRTRNALIAFQRQQGLEAIGKIDQPTIAALGLSNGAGSTTTGQSGGGTRQ